MRLKTFFKTIGWLFLIGFFSMLILLITSLIILEAGLPNVATLRDIHFQEPLRIFTSDRQLIAEFGDVRRIPVTLDKIPPPLINATLATEDQRFFSHPGVDFLGLARAGAILFLTGHKSQGGSTITMQVARNFFLTRKKTYIRKIREILLALKIDHELSKDKILELYFNKNFYGNHAYGVAAAAKIYYGKNLDELTLPEMAMLAGIPKAPSALNPLANPQAAKNRRDHVLKRMLDLHYIDQVTYESAINASLTAKYHEFKISVHAPYVAEMVRELLADQFGENSYEKGYDVFTTIDSHLQQAANHAVRVGLQQYDHRHGYRGPEKNFGDPRSSNPNQWSIDLKNIPITNGLLPAIVTSVATQSATALLKDGSTITIPWESMSWARRQLSQNGKQWLSAPPNTASDILRVGDLIRVVQNKNHQWILTQLPQAEAALVTLNPHNGAILALTGGFDYYRNKFNHITQAKRQPGSAFKPFIYSAALEKGFTLASLINDAPIAIPDSGDSTLWRPENDTHLFYGPTRLRVALTKSRNLVSIRLLQLIGIPYTIDYASRFGFNHDELPNSLSLALGTASITPLELASGYAIFANGGYQIKPYFIDHITNYTGATIYQATPYQANNSTKPAQDKNNQIAPRVISPQNAYLITSALQDVIQFGTGRPALILHRDDLAGKTGTTNDKRDGWFSGFNSNLVTTAWIGFDYPQSLHEYAIKSALPIWIIFMQEALENQPEASLSQPSDIVTIRIDKTSGLPASPDDKNTMFEVFQKHNTPPRFSNAPASHENSDEANINQLY